MKGCTIEIRLLGSFEVLVDGDDATEGLLRRRRGGDLVKLLAMAARHRLHRERIMEALWPDLPPGRAGANLRKAAYHARSALGASTAIVLDRGTVAFGEGWSAESDVAVFEETAGRALADRDPESCRRAASLYGGDLLPGDRYESWTVEPRAHLRALFVKSLEGGELWGRLVEVDPSNERGHQEIIAGHLAGGDRAGALRQFEQMRAALRDQLGVLPSERSMRLYEEALSLDAPDTPSAGERARALLAWGVVHWERNDGEEAERTARSVRALAIDAGLGRELAEASELLGLIAYAQGRWREVFAEEFIETIRATPDLAPFVVDAHMCMSEFALGEVDGLEKIGELADLIQDAALEVGSDQGKALALLLRGETSLLGNGRSETAAECLTEAYRLYEQMGSTTGTVLALERLAQADEMRGDTASARRRHREALELSLDSPLRRHLVPFVYGGMLTSQRGEAAYGLLEEAVQTTDGLDLCAPCAMSYRVGAVHVYASSGRHELAESYLSAAAEVAGMWQEGPWHSAVAEARASLIADIGGSPEEVRRLLEAATSGFATAGRPRDEARCQEALTAVV